MLVIAILMLTSSGLAKKNSIANYDLHPLKIFTFNIILVINAIAIILSISFIETHLKWELRQVLCTCDKFLDLEDLQLQIHIQMLSSDPILLGEKCSVFAEPMC